MKSTQAMRDRIRELMGREQDDCDRAVECALDDLDALVKTLTNIIEANDDFRKGMPDDWEGDPLQDACDDAARQVLAHVGERS